MKDQIPYQKAFALCLVIFCITAKSLAAGEVASFTLNNGLQIFVQEDHRAPVVQTIVSYRIGGSYEHNGSTGISHALEHMMYRGTPAYPDQGYTQALVPYGAQFNAMTGMDATTYFVNMPASLLETALRLEADRMQHVQITESSWATESQVIQEERRLRVEDDPMGLFSEHVHAMAYAGGSYQYPIIGWSSDIAALTAAQLHAWYQEYYQPNRAAIWVSGDIYLDSMRPLLEKIFGSIPSKTVKNPPEASTQPLSVPLAYPGLSSRGARSVTVDVEKGMPMIRIVFPVPTLGPALKKEDQWKPYALSLLNQILSGGKSSRLEQALVREQKVAIYAGTAYSHLSRGHGLFSMQAIPMQDDFFKTETALWQALREVQQQGVSEEERLRAIRMLEVQKIYQQDHLLEKGLDLMAFVSVGLSLEDYTQELERLGQISCAQIQAVAAEYLTEPVATRAFLRPADPEHSSRADRMKGENRS